MFKKPGSGPIRLPDSQMRQNDLLQGSVGTHTHTHRQQGRAEKAALEDTVHCDSNIEALTKMVSKKREREREKEVVPVQIFFCDPVVLKSICCRTRAKRLINEGNTTGGRRKIWTARCNVESFPPFLKLKNDPT